MGTIGVIEPLPKSTNRLNYEALKGPSVRLFNKIIKFLDNHGLEDDVEEFLGTNNIETYEIVSKG